METPEVNDQTEGKPAESIREVYLARRNSRESSARRWSSLEARISDARLVLFLAGVVIAFLMYRGMAIGSGWLIIVGIAFVALILSHEPIRRLASKATRAYEFYVRGLERLDGRWAGQGVSGLEFLDEQHPYAADLDLFGQGSLFERLCTARTRSGEVTLARWLLAPADPETIRGRQTAIRELTPRLDLREDLELLGRDVRAGIDPEELIAWGKQPQVFPKGFRFRLFLAVLGTISLILGMSSFISVFYYGQPITYFLLAILGTSVCILAFRRRAATVLEALDQRTHDLLLLSGLLARIEREPFESPTLQRLKQLLIRDGAPASTQIRKLARLLQLLDARRNQLFLPFAVLSLWTEQIALAVDAWRLRSGGEIADWLDAVGQFEAICALSSFAAENPHYCVPEIEPDQTLLHAEALGHPLIPTGVCVRNDIRLGSDAPQALVVTGSNMSGKSTMLRTVGVNVVLALAGAPVCATSFRLSRLSIGATLRIQDSLQKGKSRFFAEITRVRQIVEISRGPIPLLFLLDEIFHGTNSADRRIGAGAIVRGLLDQGAIGLVTTHDLALGEIANGPDERIANVHFEDRFEDGEIHFDYKMKSGIVHHSNALALMRSVGLEV
jgi:hypothetical protein